jgi:AcrR family transcriptional regulator
MRADTSAKLIAAARAAFAAQGYAATSMDDLCARAGLTRGALYHHFGGKDGLLEAVVRQINTEVEAELERIYDTEPDPWIGFQACCQRYLSLALDPEIQRIVLRDAPAALGQRFRTMDEAGALGPMEEALADLMQTGRIRHAPPHALARLLNGALTDAALWIAGHDTPKAALSDAQAAIKTLLGGLSAPV